jgi:acid phosphatase type 7
MSSNPEKRRRPVFKTAAYDDQEKFQPLPAPTGAYPFHLDINMILPNFPENKMIFHMAGDTGGLVSPLVKHWVANEMIKQCNVATDKPQFLFHLGDVVYNYGQAEEYYPQFFEPYRDYPCPIFAIAGNHDADIDPFDEQKRPSLDAFMKVFCDTEQREISFAHDEAVRKSNIQPNIYWWLRTPLANIIALYSNVPRFGTITPDQREWFVSELKKAAADGEKALIVCLHHAPYSADTNHGSSMHMQAFLNSAFEETGILPDVVFSGHVHNYQRLSKQYPNGKTVPFIIAGAGGYADLHKIAPLNDQAFPDGSHLLDNVQLENYCDHTHGFLRVTIEKAQSGVTIDGRYFIIPEPHNNLKTAAEFDSFRVEAGLHGG